MQLEIKFELEKKTLNLDYRRLYLSVIKSILQAENPELFNEFYGAGHTTMKDFTFYAHLGGAQFKPDEILLGSREVKLFISSMDSKLLLTIYNGVVKTKKKVYPLQNGNSMMIVSAKFMKTKEIHDSEIIVKMLSPLVARTHVKGQPDRYYLYNEEGFQQAIMNNMQRSLNCSKEELPTIEAVKGKKVIVKAMGISIPSSLGIFRLTGNPELLQILYLNGIGGRSSQGFGKFEIIE